MPNKTLTTRDTPRRWFWPVLVAVTLYFASSQSKVAGPDVIGMDKLAHFLIYGLLATLILRTQNGRPVRRFGAWGAVLLAMAYGVSDEFHQSFTPGRTVEWADLLVDTAGAALAVYLYSRWHWYRGFLEAPLGGRPRVALGAESSSHSVT